MSGADGENQTEYNKRRASICPDLKSQAELRGVFINKIGKVSIAHFSDFTLEVLRYEEK